MKEEILLSLLNLCGGKEDQGDVKGEIDGLKVAWEKDRVMRAAKEGRRKKPDGFKKDVNRRRKSMREYKGEDMTNFQRQGEGERTGYRRSPVGDVMDGRIRRGEATPFDVLSGGAEEELGNYNNTTTSKTSKTTTTTSKTTTKMTIKTAIPRVPKKSKTSLSSRSFGTVKATTEERSVVRKSRTKTKRSNDTKSTLLEGLLEGAGGVRFVACPLCCSNVKVRRGKDGDEVLALHMATCEGNIDSNGRGNRRRRKIIDIDVSSGEEEEGEVDEEVMEFADVDSSSEEEGVFDEEEVIVVDDVKGGGRGGNRVKKDKGRFKDTSGRGRDKDDSDPSIYEERLKEWKERMVEDGDKDSELQHSLIPEGTERRKGEVSLQGGFVIPEYVANRLFPYQITGLRWMWELNRQGCGGIVGDEMGLGKTVQVSAFLGCMCR